MEMCNVYYVVFFLKPMQLKRVKILKFTMQQKLLVPRMIKK